MTHETGDAMVDTSATIEHIIPTSKGGEDNPTNWAASCFKCNQTRGSHSHRHFQKMVQGGKYFPTRYVVPEWELA